MLVCMYCMQRCVYVIAYSSVCIRLNADACDLLLQSACAHLYVYMNHYICMQLHADLCNHCMQICAIIYIRVYRCVFLCRFKTNTCSMHVCMCVYIYAHTMICVCVCINVYIHIRLFSRINQHICIHVCVHTYVLHIFSYS